MASSTNISNRAVIVFPSLLIAVLLAFNFAGDSLRGILDPRLRGVTIEVS